MQRLDPTAEHLGRPRHRLDRRVLDAPLAEGARRPATGHECPTESEETPREMLETGLVVDTQQGDGHQGSSPRAKRATVSGYRRRSTALIRSCSVAVSSPGS